jgi:hypothetical protein
VEGEHSQNDMIRHIRRHSSERFEIVENAPALAVRRWEHKRAARWFIPAAAFTGFEYGYIGDVDMLVLREPEGVTRPHSAHADVLGIPYSNAVREKQHRLTGLHFINVEPYFEKMAPFLEAYRRDGKFCCMNNERVLYEMVQEGIGIPVERMRQNHYRPHHGIHLGLFREKRRTAMCRTRYHESGETQQAQRQFVHDDAFMWLVEKAVERYDGRYLRYVFSTLAELLRTWE